MTFAPDSALVDLVAPGRGYSRGKLIPRGHGAYGFAVHTTGGGPARRYKRSPGKFEDEFAAAAWIYGTIMDAAPQYLLCGDTGRLAQLVPEGLCAWHIGGRRAAAYFKRPDRWWGWRAKDAERYAWWRERWPDYESPRDLAGGMAWAPYKRPPSLAKRVRYPRSWAKGSANYALVGVDVVPPRAGARAPWSDACWAKLAALTMDVAKRNAFQVRRDTVATHSDFHPLARTTPRGEPWDTVPEQFSYDRLLREIAKPSNRDA